MKCPDCDRDGFNVYKSFSESDKDGKTKVIQYRKCDYCGYREKTSYDKWVCELNPEDYLSN